MRDMIRQARKKAGLTQEEVARRMFLGLRQYQRLEHGEQALSPEEAVRLAELLKSPSLIMVYCRNCCAIGRRYGYEALNNVDLSPQNILLKLYQEHKKAGEAIGRMLITVVNKQQVNDFTDGERGGFAGDLHDLLDLEHALATLKMELGERQWCDIPQLVGEHNSKCCRRGYVIQGGHGLIREEGQVYAYGLAG